MPARLTQEIYLFTPYMVYTGIYTVELQETYVLQYSEYRILRRVGRIVPKNSSAGYSTWHLYSALFCIYEYILM